MRLIEKINQHRRDFDGKYECEGCNNVDIHNDCYDDDNFHQNVAPNIFKCSKCNKTTKELGVDVEKVSTKYASYEVV